MPGRRSKGRLETRANVFLSASLVTPSARLPVRIRNLSARGALLDGERLPAAGAAIHLLRGAHRAAGEIAWRQGRLAGVNLVEEIDVAAWVRRAESSIDKGKGSATGAPKGAQPSFDEGAEAALTALKSISRDLDQLLAVLASAPPMAAGFGKELTKLSILARRLRRLAEL